MIFHFMYFHFVFLNIFPLIFMTFSIVQFANEETLLMRKVFFSPLLFFQTFKFYLVVRAQTETHYILLLRKTSYFYIPF